ncbi:hypothetical protein BDK51DRAFT_33269, partial [Blyttiomyces helicus]
MPTEPVEPSPTPFFTLVVPEPHVPLVLHKWPIARTRPNPPPAVVEKAPTPVAGIRGRMSFQRVAAAAAAASSGEGASDSVREEHGGGGVRAASLDRFNIKSKIHRASSNSSFSSAASAPAAPAAPAPVAPTLQPPPEAQPLSPLENPTPAPRLSSNRSRAAFQLPIPTRPNLLKRRSSVPSRATDEEPQSNSVYPRAAAESPKLRISGESTRSIAASVERVNHPPDAAVAVQVQRLAPDVQVDDVPRYEVMIRTIDFRPALRTSSAQNLRISSRGNVVSKPELGPRGEDPESLRYPAVDMMTTSAEESLDTDMPLANEEALGQPAVNAPGQTPRVYKPRPFSLHERGELPPSPSSSTSSPPAALSVGNPARFADDLAVARSPDEEPKTQLPLSPAPSPQPGLKRPPFTAQRFKLKTHNARTAAQEPKVATFELRPVQEDVSELRFFED